MIVFIEGRHLIASIENWSSALAVNEVYYVWVSKPYLIHMISWPHRRDVGVLNCWRDTLQLFATNWRFHRCSNCYSGWCCQFLRGLGWCCTSPWTWLGYELHSVVLVETGQFDIEIVSGRVIEEEVLGAKGLRVSTVSIGHWVITGADADQQSTTKYHQKPARKRNQVDVFSRG